MRKLSLAVLFLCGLAHAQDASVSPAPEPGSGQGSTQTTISTASPEGKPLTGYNSSYGYKDGFFIQSEDGKFAMTISGWVQSLFVGQRVEGGPDTDNFSVRRARIQFRGHVFDPQFQYSLDYDIGANKLRNTFVQWVESQQFKLRAGYWKVPFDFEAASISYQFQFIDRSIAYTKFGVPDLRESGVGFNGKLMNKKLEYEIDAFNGEPTGNQNNELRYAGRLVYNVAGQNGYEVSDLDNSDLGLALGVGGMYNDTPDPTTIPVGGTVATSEMKVTSFTADSSLKYHGVGAVAAFLYQNINPDIAASHSDKGWVAQLGYFIIPNKLEIAGRVAHVYTVNDQGEYTFGANYYIAGGNHVKLQLDASELTTQNGVAPGNDRSDQRIRMQFQVRI